MIDLVLKSGLDNFGKRLGFSKIITTNIIEARTINDLNKQINKTKGLMIVKSNPNISRAIFENKNINIIINLETSPKKDSLHYKISGLNQVLCKLAVKNKIIIGISLQNILNTNTNQRKILLGRIIQNIKLCNKYKVKVIIASFAENKWEMRGKNDIEAFGRVLGIEKLKNKDIITYKKEGIGIKEI